jgi:hypothetical protein
VGIGQVEGHGDREDGEAQGEGDPGEGPSADRRKRSAGVSGVPARVGCEHERGDERPSAIIAMAKGTRKRH